MSCNEYWKRKTLIIGEVKSGKTERTLRILRDLIRCRRDPIAVLDLAPENIRGVGGKILWWNSSVFYDVSDSKTPKTAKFPFTS